MIKTLKDIPELKGKRVLVRVDFNVPMSGEIITDDTRIVQTLPTIKYLIEKGAKVILMTHIGRPDGKIVEELRTKPIAQHLETLLNNKVLALSETVGEKVEESINKMEDGEIIFLENTRFYPGEEVNSEDFCGALAKLADIFINDAFATAHRLHASTAGVADYIPAYAGLLIEKEIKFLNPLLNSSQESLTLIMGGAKVDTKIGVLKSYIGKANAILIGGALANTFLAAQGHNIGESKYEKDKVDVARELMLLAEEKKQKFYLPIDSIVADHISHDASAINLPIEDIEGDMKILDIGKKTQVIYQELIRESKCVLFNGPMGLYEYKQFASGTSAIARELVLNPKVESYLGGGDTIDAIKRDGFTEEQFTFVSTGGGATLEFLEGKELPGIAVLKL